MKRRVALLIAGAVLIAGSAYAVGRYLRETPIRPGTLTPSPTSGSSGPAKKVKNPFGAMGCPLPCAQAMGVAFYRPSAVLLGLGTTSPSADQFVRAGYKLVLTVKNTSGLREPSQFPGDLDEYRRNIGEVIDHYRDSLALLVVENEESNVPMFGGTSEQYAQMLAAACDEAHARGVKCANGGILSRDILFWVYNRLLQQGQQSTAGTYWTEAADPFFSQARVGSIAPLVQPWIDHVKEAGADYFNFHAYYRDGRALKTTADILSQYTGLPVITNELGVHEGNPDIVASLCEGVLEAKLPLAVFYTARAGPNGVMMSLPDGSLTDVGQAAANCIRSHTSR